MPARLIDTKRIVRILYTNHRGEASWRRVIPLGAPKFISTEWHPEQQWVLPCYDVDKELERSFAMKDIHRWEPEMGKNS